MKYPPETLLKWFEIIESQARGLSTWEEEFLESAREQFNRRGELSDRQVEIVERIYTEKVK